MQIAQLSSVYEEVKEDATGEYLLNKARIIFEKEGWLSKEDRLNFSALTITYDTTSLPRSISDSLEEEDRARSEHARADALHKFVTMQLEERKLAEAALDAAAESSSSDVYTS